MASVRLNGSALLRAVTQAFDDAVVADIPNIKTQHDAEVPLLTGELRNSFSVERLSPGHFRFTSSAEAENGFNYALKQHEDVSLNHSDGRKAHYLRDPVMDSTKRLAVAIRGTLGGR